MTPRDKPFLVEDNDNELGSLTDILRELHRDFYDTVDQDGIALPDVTLYPDLDVKVCIVFQSF